MIQPYGGELRIIYQGRELTVTHKVFCAVDPGAGEGDRIKYGDRYFLILRVLNVDERGELWRMDCLEVVK